MSLMEALGMEQIEDNEEESLLHETNGHRN
jgi:hypothetical protein